MPAPKPYILQDRTKALMIGVVLYNGGSPVPNFTLTFMSGFDSTVFGTVDVVNPNGNEPYVTVALLLDQNTIDASNNGLWWNGYVTLSGLPGGVTLYSGPGIYSAFDSWGGEGGTYGVYRDPDGTSIWTATWSYAGLSVFQKYDIRTRAFLDHWVFPFQDGQALWSAVADGTTVFFQDSASNLYAMTSNSGSFTPNQNTPQRLHKVDKTTKLEIAALGYDQIYPDPVLPFPNKIYGPVDWCVFKNTDDFVAFASANGFLHVINLTTMTLVGSFDMFGTYGHYPRGVMKDEDGVTILFGCDSNSDANAYIYTWTGGISGTVGADPQLSLTLTTTIPGANFQSGTPSNGNAIFWRYIGGADEGDYVLIADYSTGEEGYGGDLALINEAGGGQVAFVSSAEPSIITTGDIDSAYHGFRDNKTLAYDPGVVTVIGDTLLSFTPAQLGGVLNFLDSGTLAITNSYNITNIYLGLNVSQLPQYTYQGNWDSGTNYEVGDIVTGSDGNLYLALTTSGPSDIMGIGVLDPNTWSYTPNARPVNWFNWVGLPAFYQGINTGSRNPAFPTLGGYAYDLNTNSIVTGYDFVGSTALITYLAPLNGPFLSDLIHDISIRCGLDGSQIDVSQCETIPVEGYLLTSQVDGKTALQNPLAAYFVDGVEEDFIMKFVPRGVNSSVMTIAEQDLGLVKDKAKLVETIPQQQELPQIVSVVFVDPSIDWQQNTQLKGRSSRAIKTKQTITMSLPMVFTTDQARAIAEKALYLAYLNSQPFDINIANMKYAVLSPTDVVQFVYENNTRQMRLMSTTMGVDYTLTLNGVSDDSNTYISVTTGVNAEGVPPNIGVPLSPSVLFLLDVPYLQDSDAVSDRSHSGYYWGGSASGSTWTGEILFKSDDNVTFDSVDSTPARMVYGVTGNPGGSPPYTSILGDPPTLWSWDTSNSLIVKLADPTWTLAGTTDLAVLNGANVLIVGGEVIQYVNAVQNTDGSYTLSRLLRGRRNTEYAAYGHAADENVFDPTTGLVHESSSLVLIGLLRYYKGVTVGQDITAVTSQSFTDNANDLKPAEPVHITGSRDISSNLTIGWTRRTRYAGDWLNNSGNVPLNEDSEAYSIDIYGLVGSPAVETVVRTINWTPGTYDSNGNPQATYSAADQTTDFGSPQSSVLLYVYQISGQVGRGFPGIATI